MKRFLMLVVCCACLTVVPACQTYDGYYAYSNTRKVWNSESPAVVRVVGSFLLALPETLWSPVSLYVDASNRPPTSDDGHTYWSYVGSRTLWDSTVHDVGMVAASLVMVPFETLWFPIGGIVDGVHVLVSGE